MTVYCTLYIVCILLRHPDEGRRSEPNTSMNSNTHMMYICWFFAHVQDIFSSRIWNIYEVFQDVAKVEGPMILSEFSRRRDMQFLYEGYKQAVSQPHWCGSPNLPVKK